MKKLLLRFHYIYILLIIVTNVNAQETYGKAVYKYTFHFPSSTKDTLIGELYFNDVGESYFKGQNVNTFDRKNSTYESTIPERTVKIDSDIVYRNILTKEYFYQKRTLMNNYIVSDTLNELHWELKSENKKIGNFNCTLAKTKFSGRIYQVWYTTEIPVSSGPWKLYGLPGLIIEAQDDEGVVHFILDKIELSPIYKKDFGIENLQKQAVTRQYLIRKREKDIERFQGYGKSMGVTVRVNTVSKGLELEDN